MPFNQQSTKSTATKKSALKTENIGTFKMTNFRLNPKPFIAIGLMFPLIFFLLQTGPGNSIDYTVDSNNKRTFTNSAIETLSNGQMLNTDEAKMVQQEKSALIGTSDTVQCFCDNNKSVLNHLPFVPNKPIFAPDRVIIFIITPTYTRPTQMPDMTRLAQTLRLVPDIFWIVAEDATVKSKQVEDLLLRTNIPFVQLLGPRPPTHMDKRSGRGVSNRLKAFQWLRENYNNTGQPGVIYLADDDNAYDIRIFDEIRNTQIVSMFPVGLIARAGLSSPIVSKNTGKIIGFHDPFIGRRKFAVDMAGFAVNLQYFLKHEKATMPYKVGYEEDYFLRSLEVKIWELEPKANNCTKIYVWHTKTKPADPPRLSLMKKVVNYSETNLPKLYEDMGVVEA